MLNCIKNILFGIYYKLYNIIINQNNINLNYTVNNIISKYHEPSKLKIMSYNINGFFCYYNHNNYLNIANFLYQEIIENKVDIICLQEVWLKNIYNIIINKIKNLNLYISCPSNKIKYYFGEHSGLLIISRLKILNCNFIKYKNLTSLCKLTNKGFQHISIKYDNKLINIINTHLQSSYKYFNYTTIAFNQIETIMNYCNNNNIIEYLIIGDLNLNQNYITNILDNYNNIKIPYK